MSSLLGIGRRLVWAATAVLGLTSVEGRAQDAERVVIAPIGQEEVVYSWSKQRCSDDFIPDSPARAFRRPDNSIALIAAHYHNQFLTGKNFNDIKPDCRTMSTGAESDDPRSFDTRYWIQALVPSNGKLIALASHEYAGNRHGQCLTKLSCWYSSIIELTADQQELRFRYPDAFGQRLVAVPTKPYDQDRKQRYGFFSTSNIVSDGGYAYVFVWSEQDSKPRNCLLRAPLKSVVGNWSAYHNGSFEPEHELSGGEAKNDECDAIAPEALRGQLRSLVRFRDKWVGVFMQRSKEQVKTGIYYSTSPDLLRWSAPTYLAHFEPWYGGSGCGVFYDYPSLIDHGSKSSFFDSANDELFLYLTRMNWADCSGGLNRDLVRIPLGISVNAK